MSDTISRQQAIDETRKCRFVVDAIEKIRGLPSAEPERKKEKWIFLDECSNSGYYCPKCHKKVVKEGWSNAVKKINFCPNCGYDMKGEQDD